MKLKILHLSDFHFKADDPIQDMVTTTLLEKIGDVFALEEKPQVLVITGDVAYSGKSEEYKKAGAFIDAVAQTCGLTAEMVFVIPGNHDVDRARIEDGAIDWWYRFKDENALNRVLFSKISFSAIKSTTAAFDDFAAKYMGQTVSGPYGEYLAEIPFGERNKVKIVGLNSALFCGYDGDDLKKLALGLPQIGIFNSVNSTEDIVISLVHHPEEHFHVCEKPTLSRLHATSDIVLSGHVHEPANSLRLDGYTNQTVFVGAGAAYEKRNFHNSFNVVILDSNSLSGEVKFYKYLPDRHIWVVNTDINNVTDGIFRFSLRKSKTKKADENNIETSDDVKLQTQAISSTVFAEPPLPPALYAKPRYPESQIFVGRKAELNVLNDWASHANSKPMLLFEAMGGTGKSILTWHWITKYAVTVRNDWTGLFWYSFYEKGATMADFCRHALGYMARLSNEALRDMKTPQLAEWLILELKKKPWLIVMDGLERVLEDYNTNRYAEDVLVYFNQKEVKDKHPCACINDEDEALLQMLSAAAPSKILASSRLTPRILLNNADQPIPGVYRYPLQGLRPEDAEDMFHNCGIHGNSLDIQNFLVGNCDCHPLTIGALGGLINHYLPSRGNFDAWLDDRINGVGALDLSNLDLNGRQNHILSVSMDALGPMSRQLLLKLALIYDSVGYDALVALNPHVDSGRKLMSPNSRLPQVTKVSSQAKTKSIKKLEETVADLEQRGLLQYDKQTARYELHPVVRAIAASKLDAKETERYGKQVVDYFSSRPRLTYQNVKTLEDVSDLIHIVRTLLRMEKYQEAYQAYHSELSRALMFNLEEFNHILILIGPFFPDNWSDLPQGLYRPDSIALASHAASSLISINKNEEALKILNAVMVYDIADSDIKGLQHRLRTVALSLRNMNDLAGLKRSLDLALKLNELHDDQQSLFLNRLFMFGTLSILGIWDKADQMWALLSTMSRDWPYRVYRPGDAEYNRALSHFFRNKLEKSELDQAFAIAINANNRINIRRLHALTGAWYFYQGEWGLAIESLSKAISLARSVVINDSESEILLATAKFHLGQLDQPKQVVERLAAAKGTDHCALADLYFLMGEKEQAKHHAMKAYGFSLANGDPFVHRYKLNKSIEVLQLLGEAIPDLTSYDLIPQMEYPWEKAIKKLLVSYKKSSRKRKGK